MVEALSLTDSESLENTDFAVSHGKQSTSGLPVSSTPFKQKQTDKRNIP